MSKTLIPTILLSIMLVVVVTTTTGGQSIDPTDKLSDQYITLKVENSKNLINIPLTRIPKLQEYLEGSLDKELEIERIRTTLLRETEHEALIVLSYSCGNKNCESIFVRLIGEQLYTLQLPYGIFKEYQFSPDGNLIFLVFGMNEASINRNLLTIVNIDEMEFIFSHVNDSVIEFMTEAKWPFIEYYWIDNRSIFLSIPDIPSVNFELIEEWYKSEHKETKEFVIRF